MHSSYEHPYEAKFQKECENLRQIKRVPYSARLEKKKDHKLLIIGVAVAAALALGGAGLAIDKQNVDYYTSVIYTELVHIPGMSYDPTLNIRGDRTAFFSNADGDVFYDANGVNANVLASQKLNEINNGPRR